MKIEYTPSGVCSKKMEVEVENGVIKEVSVLGGCNGNLKGISRLVQGMDAEEAIRRLEGTICGHKSTSCPDQLSKAIRKALEAEK